MMEPVPFLLVLSLLLSAAQVPLVPKEQRTAAQRKIESRLLQVIDARREGKKSPSADASPLSVKLDKQGRALVDIRTEVTAVARRNVTRLGGAIVSTSSEYRSIVAWMPLLTLEQLAGDASVRSIIAAPQATTNR